MPSLKQISCCIQWVDTAAPFQEYGTQYGDGVVESFIVVPAQPQGFCIRLTSHGYISEGLAMVVFVDGNYQCNRLRLNLLPSKKGRPANRTEVDFLLRQQEKPQGDGIYLGRAWRFDNHNIVPEAPEGFQASHFDDLGTIEVLVLRCRARDQADADYDGSSSGEDSDIFEDRPTCEEEDDILTAETTTTTAASASAPTPAVAEPEDEGMMGAMFGLFDGANDMYDPRSRRSGQWVWHQKDRPRGLLPDIPPTLHAVPDTRFRTTSHMPPNAYYQPQQIPHYPTVPSSQPSKQVHFDFGRASTSRHRELQDRHSRSSNRQAYPTQQRPESRERVRSSDQRRDSSPISRAPPPEPYPPQSISSRNDQQTYSNQRNVSQQQHVQNQQSTRQSYRDEPRENWTSDNPAQADQNTDCNRNDTNRATDQHSQTTHHGQSAPQSQPIHSNQQSYAQSYPTNLRDQYVYQSQNSLPHLNQATHLPQYTQYHTPEYPYVPPPQPPPIVPPFYASYLPSAGHMYPPQVIMPPEYAQPGGYPHPYWPYHYAGPYAYPQQHGSPDSPRIIEQISPKNNTLDDLPINENGQGASPAVSNQQSPQNNDANWVSEGNDANAVNGDANQDDTDNWNNATDNQDNNGNSWDDQNPNNTTDTSGNNWDNSNDNSNNNNNSGEWDSNNQNNATDNNAWENTNNNETSNDQRPNDNPPDAQHSEPDLIALANAARDLYGPHGLYYSFRALRVDEPKPDAQEEPRYDVPKEIALARGSTKQVQPGPGYRYYKRKLEPEYIDTMDNPYARFVFKYRTKEQLAEEIGIAVDVEPTGDEEIQRLQGFDKKALIEMLLQAKTALGGKIPSAPPTPSTSATASDLGPVAVEAPKLPYLKYSLPPLRPSNFSKKSTPSNSAAASKTSLVGKENVAPAQNSSNGSWNNDSSANNSNNWNNNTNANNNNANNNDWVAMNSPAQSNASKPGSQHGLISHGSRQTSKSSGSKRAPAVEEAPDDSLPPRPPTPDNWNAAAPNNGTANAWENDGQGNNQQPASGW